VSTSLIDVACSRSSSSIRVNNIAHVEGGSVRFVIDEGMALVDARGNIRFFVVDFDDGERCGYLLSPYYKKVSDVDPFFINSVSWVASAFAAYGLGKARTKLTNTKNAAIDVGGFFLLNAFNQKVTTPLIKSFSDSLFSHDELNFGYRNIATDRLIFLETLSIPM